MHKIFWGVHDLFETVLHFNFLIGLASSPLTTERQLRKPRLSLTDTRWTVSTSGCSLRMHIPESVLVQGEGPREAEEEVAPEAKGAPEVEVQGPEVEVAPEVEVQGPVLGVEVQGLAPGVKLAQKIKVEGPAPGVEVRVQAP